jgi:hypothetical protein
MFQTWVSLSLLALEANQVMWLRMCRLMALDRRASSEAMLMTTEKVFAAQDAVGRMIRGDSSESIIRGYRSKVRANRKRLSR